MFLTKRKVAKAVYDAVEEVHRINRIRPYYGLEGESRAQAAMEMEAYLNKRLGLTPPRWDDAE